MQQYPLPTGRLVHACAVALIVAAPVNLAAADSVSLLDLHPQPNVNPAAVVIPERPPASLPEDQSVEAVLRPRPIPMASVLARLFDASRLVFVTITFDGHPTVAFHEWLRDQLSIDAYARSDFEPQPLRPGEMDEPMLVSTYREHMLTLWHHDIQTY